MKTESRIMSYGVQTNAFPWIPSVLDHKLWKQDDITQNSPNPNITLNHALNGCLNPKGIQVLKEYDNKMIQNRELSYKAFGLFYYLYLHQTFLFSHQIFQLTTRVVKYQFYFFKFLFYSWGGGYESRMSVLETPRIEL